MISLLVIDNDVLLKMASNPRVLSELPELASMFTRLRERVAAQPSCGSCGGSQPQLVNNVPDFGAMRSALAGLPTEKRVRLRELLGAKQIRLYYQDAGGATRGLVF